MKKERSFAQIFSKYGVLMVFIVMFIMFSIFAPNFLRVKNLLNVSRQICTLGICAVGTTIVLISGGIDLSLGYQLSVTNVLCAYLMVKMGMHPVLAILVCLVFGVTVGAINGIIIVKSGVHSMIVTLAISQVLNGVSYLFSRGIPIYGFPAGFSILGQGTVFGIIPVSMIIMAVIFLVGHFVLTSLPFGRYLYAVGSNEEAAKLAGVNTGKVRILAHTLCGLLSAIAGVLLLSRTNSGLSSNGAGFEFNVITACVLGGVSNLGGKGTIYQALLGVLIIGFLENGMLLMNVNEYWQLVVKGLLLLIAVVYDASVVRSSERVKKLKAINSENTVK